MSEGSVWIYKYIIKTPWFRVAVFRNKFKKTHKGWAYFYFEYKKNGVWRQIFL